MNSLELVNELYKPYKITRKGLSTIIECMDGKFVIKPKKDKDIKSVFSYLKNCSFENFPNLIDDTRSDIDIFEYIDETPLPKEQKFDSLMRTVAKLHNSTSFQKEVSEDKYKSIYESIHENLNYFKDIYTKMVDEIETHVFMSPSEYLFIRNSSKLNNQIAFCQNKLDSWYDMVKNKKTTRVSLIHNNLSLDHFIKGKKDCLISWNSCRTDSPVLDIYKLYEKEALNVEFSSALKNYISSSNLEKEDRELLFILLCLPKKFELHQSEFASCATLGNSLDYVFKTENLVRPYYSIDDKEE